MFFTQCYCIFLFAELAQKFEVFPQYMPALCGVGNTSCFAASEFEDSFAFVIKHFDIATCSLFR